MARSALVVQDAAGDAGRTESRCCAGVTVVLRSGTPPAPAKRYKRTRAPVRRAACSTYRCAARQITSTGSVTMTAAAI